MHTIEFEWEKIIEYFRVKFEIDNILFAEWIKPMQIQKILDRTLYVKIKLNAWEDYLKVARYKRPMQISIEEVTGEEVDLIFVTGERSFPCKQYNRSKELGLNVEYTFDTFVVEGSNELAYSVAYYVANEPGKWFNPLFIYGDVGGGKTHLLHAIANYIAENSLQSNVLYTTSKMFTNEFIELTKKCGQNLSSNIIREKYCEADILLIDDIQFIIGNESILEEFFHIYNRLYRTGKQIVISSDRPPIEMNTLQGRIRARFEWGLLAEIGVLEYETRMAILRGKKNRNIGNNINMKL